MKTYALIPSGGSGKRSGQSIPKQYLEFNGKELIAYTLENFQMCELVDEIVIAAQPDFFDKLNSIIEKYNFTKVTEIVEGGSERQNSVFNALSSISAEDDDLIAVHDAARPLLTTELLSNALMFARENGSVTVGIKAKDTLVKVSDIIADYIDREEVYYVQTPQIFRYKVLNEAFEKANFENFLGTDESMLVKRAGYKVQLFEGTSLNFKVTTEDDIKLFNLLSKALQ